MTGEITLTGRVLAIGGLREKSMAALRNGIKTVIIPALNELDIDEFSDTVKNGIKFVPVKTIDEVFRIAFAEPPSKSRTAKGKKAEAAGRSKEAAIDENPESSAEVTPDEV